MGALLFSLLPALLYCVTTFGLAWELQHVWSLLLLASAPLLMLTTMKVSPSFHGTWTCGVNNKSTNAS